MSRLSEPLSIRSADIHDYNSTASSNWNVKIGKCFEKSGCDEKIVTAVTDAAGESTQDRL
jgi:hypothetical protein